MQLKLKTESFSLSTDGIDAFSDWLSNMLADTPVERKNRLRTRLLTEELLLRMQERSDGPTPFLATLDLRPGRASLRLEIDGPAFNPLGQTTQALGDWNDVLLTAVGLQPRYAYLSGKNILRLQLPKKRMTPALKMLLFFLVAIAAGLLGYWLFPQEAREACCGAVLKPAFEFWMRILNAASGPIIFFMSLSTMLNINVVTRQGGSGVQIIRRYLLITFLLIAAALVFVFPFFHLENMSGTGPKITWFDALSSFIPENIIQPFLTSHTPQLLLLAFSLGAAMLAAADQAKGLRRGIREINVVGSIIAKGLSNMIPFLTAAFLCLEIWDQRVRILLGMWKPLALSFGASVLLLGVANLCFACMMKINVFYIPKKLWTLFLSVLRGVPLDEIMETAVRTSSGKFGVDRHFAEVCLPQGMVLFMPFSAIGTLIFTTYMLNDNQISLSIVWQILTVLLVELLFVATPPVPGANLLAFSVLFSWLGIPSEAILDAMIFDIIFGYFASAANLALLQMETAQQAKRLGLMKIDVLRKKA